MGEVHIHRTPPVTRPIEPRAGACSLHVFILYELGLSHAGHSIRTLSRHTSAPELYIIQFHDEFSVSPAYRPVDDSVLNGSVFGTAASTQTRGHTTYASVYT